MTIHRYHTYNFRFQLLRRKIVLAYNIAAVCCKSHVQENMLSSFPKFYLDTRQNHISVSEFEVSLQNSGCHFDTQKRLKKHRMRHYDEQKAVVVV